MYVYPPLLVGLTIKQRAEYNRKRRCRAKGPVNLAVALGHSHKARTEGVGSTPGVIAELFPGRGGWCLWCKIELLLLAQKCVKGLRVRDTPGGVWSLGGLLGN